MMTVTGPVPAVPSVEALHQQIQQGLVVAGQAVWVTSALRWYLVYPTFVMPTKQPPADWDAAVAEKPPLLAGVVELPDGSLDPRIADACGDHPAKAEQPGYFRKWARVVRRYPAPIVTYTQSPWVYAVPGGNYVVIDSRGQPGGSSSLEMRHEDGSVVWIYPYTSEGELEQTGAQLSDGVVIRALTPSPRLIAVSYAGNVLWERPVVGVSSGSVLGCSVSLTGQLMAWTGSSQGFVGGSGAAETVRLNPATGEVLSTWGPAPSYPSPQNPFRVQFGVATQLILTKTDTEVVAMPSSSASDPPVWSLDIATDLAHLGPAGQMSAIACPNGGLILYRTSTSGSLRAGRFVLVAENGTIQLQDTIFDFHSRVNNQDARCVSFDDTGRYALFSSHASTSSGGGDTVVGLAVIDTEDLRVVRRHVEVHRDSFYLARHHGAVFRQDGTVLFVARGEHLILELE